MNMFDLVDLIRAAGYTGLFAIIFAESGLFLGFFLPGDSLLFTAGFLASQGYLDIVLLISLTFAGAVLGDSFGYAFGKHTGPAIFSRENSLLFDRRHIQRAKQFYDRHGAKTIVLARFVPIVRTFAPILAGVGIMPYKMFLLYNVSGALLWAIGVPAAGYYLGNTIPNIDRYLFPIIAGIIFLSLLPTIVHILKDPEHRAQLLDLLRKRSAPVESAPRKE